MGLSGVSLGSLLVIFSIAVLIFGTKRLGSLGSDLAKAVKGFQHGMRDEDNEGSPETSSIQQSQNNCSEHMHKNNSSTQNDCSEIKDA